MTQKRLFFGFDAITPPIVWPEDKRRPSSLHLTLAFLGSIHFEEGILENCPIAPEIGMAAIGKKILLLPEGIPKPRALACLVEEPSFELEARRQKLLSWLKSYGYDLTFQPFLPHLTLARRPFDSKKWQDCFYPFPIILSDLHLYESLGNLTYRPIWTKQMTLPLVELEHTADVAFFIRGKTLEQLHFHAQIALAWKAPLFLRLLSHFEGSSLDDIIIDLNHKIALVDVENGSYFKAVSFHGEISVREDGLLEWEMIIDV